MSLTQSEIIEILKVHRLAPLRRLGQNFLVDKNIIEKVISLINQNESVVEIGPGLGALTVPVAQKAKEVIVFEKDEKIAEILENEILPPLNNVIVIKSDILRISEIEITGSYTLLANLPFYITSIVIRKFLESSKPPKKMVLMVQREVAKRICSNPPNMNLLALSVQFYAKPKIVFNVSKNSFWPSPKVDCSVLIIERDSSLKGDPVKFFRAVRAGFSHPRAQVLNNLSKELKLNKEEIKKTLLSLKIDPKRRAESLNLNEWLKLSQEIE